MRLNHTQFRDLAWKFALVEHGLLREVSPHAAVLRVDVNLDPHHRLVCTRCKPKHNA